MESEVDSDIIDEMRRLARSGAVPTQILRALQERLAADPSTFRLRAILHFREAFQLSIGDAKRIGAASMFPDSARSDQDLDAELLPLILAKQDLWR